MRNSPEEQKSFFIKYLAIGLLTILCYFPSLFHLPRADHLAYLAEVAGKSDFISIMDKSIDLARTRLFIPGDAMLFRPLLFLFMATEQYYFGHQFIFWQMTGLMLHLLAVFFLLKLLLNIRKNIMAYVGAAFFGLSVMQVEMVTWTHIQGYLIFVILMLIILDQLFSYIEREDFQAWRLNLVSGLLWMACFTYEGGIICSILTLVYFSMRAPKAVNTPGNKLILILPVIIYFLCSFLDAYAKGMGWEMFHSLHGKGSILKSILALPWQMAMTDATWISFGLFPFQWKIALQQRTTFLLGQQISSLSIMSLGLWALATYIFITFKKKMAFFQRWGFHSFLFWMILSYTLMIVAGRVLPLGLGTLINNTYYAYIYWALLLPFLYVSIDFDKWSSFSLGRGSRIFIFLFIVIFIILNAFRVWAVNDERLKRSIESLILVQSIEDAKCHFDRKKKFLFYMSPSAVGNFPLAWLNKVGDPPGREYTFIEVLYLDSFHAVETKSRVSR